MLVTVGDQHRLSYYADRTLSCLLSLPAPGLCAACAELLCSGQIAFEPPLYQILELVVAA